MVRIGSRASKLAQTQARQVQAAIAQALGAPAAEAGQAAPIVLISTSGDRIQDRRLLEAGGKGLFTKEIEEALLEGRIDCAVHSYKDVPAEAVPGLVIAAVPEREDARDAFLPAARRLASLPQGPAPRHRHRAPAQALTAAPTCGEIMRGNVDTRLAKSTRRADASCWRSPGCAGSASTPRPELSIPSPPRRAGQGALAVQTS